MIYQTASARHLGFARIIVYGLLLAKTLADPIAHLADFPVEAFLPHGVLRAIPSEWLPRFLSPVPLLAFKWTYVGLLTLSVLGLGPRLVVLSVTIVGAVLHHGLARGFGGHVNHQELIVLHCAIILLFFPCTDGFALNRFFRRRRNGADHNRAAIYRFALRTLCFWIATTYFFIALTRLTTSGFGGFLTNTMSFYALQHSTKWNYWDISLARDLLDQPWLRALLTISFPLATVLEFSVPLALFVRKLTRPIVVSLWVFHGLIFVFMNIFFWEQMVLLFLFVLPAAGGAARPAVKEAAVVFFDAACDRCQRFVRWVARRDPEGRIQFAPLGGVTARDRGLRSAMRSVIFDDGSRRYEGSAAVFHVLTALPGWTDCGKLLLALPPWLAGPAYRGLAAIRRRRSAAEVMSSLADQPWRERLLP